MSGQPDGSTWLAWIMGTISVGGALYVTGKRIFSTVTRSELTEIIKAQDEKFLAALNRQRDDFQHAAEASERERLRLHGENRDTAKETFNRLSGVERGLSRIEGQLSNCLPQPDAR